MTPTGQTPAAALISQVIDRGRTVYLRVPSLLLRAQKLSKDRGALICKYLNVPVE
jgi:hypothetical protein